MATFVDLDVALKIARDGSDRSNMCIPSVTGLAYCDLIFNFFSFSLMLIDQLNLDLPKDLWTEL